MPGRCFTLNVILLLTVTLALLVLPGLLLALALRLRGWTAVGTAPLLTAALVLVAILVVSTLDVAWTPLAFAVVTIAGTALVAGADALRSRRTVRSVAGPPAGAGDRESRTWSAMAVLGTLAGAAIGFATVVPATDGLTRPNQGFDAIFHVNLVETIARTGEVAPDVAGQLNGYPDGASVYPDAFHALVSLVDQVHGGSLTGINALMACLPVVAGVGLVALLRDLGAVRAAAVVPVTVAATSGFPTDLVWRGPIWVYVFGLSLIPALVVLVRQSLRRADVLMTPALGLSAAALALVHPSAALSGALFVVCLVSARWLGTPGVVRRDLVVLGPAAVLAAVLALPLIGKAVVDTSGGTVVDWPAVQSAGEALGELLLYNYDNVRPQVWLAAPALVGIVVAWRSPALRWWYGATAGVALLCVLAAAYEGPLVQVLTGPWWNDRFRFAGLVFLALSVFAAVGVAWTGALVGSVVERLAARLRIPAPGFRTPAVVAGVCVVVAVIGLSSSGFYVPENRERMEKAYVAGGGGSVSDADLAAFEELRDLAGAGPVLNDPNDGSAWMWSLAGVRPVFGAALTIPVKPPLPSERQLVVEGLNCLDSSDVVRSAVEELGVRYVYSSSSTILGSPTPNEGFRDLSSVASLSPVYERDGVTIYEIRPVPLQETPSDACRLG